MRYYLGSGKLEFRRVQFLWRSDYTLISRSGDPRGMGRCVRQSHLHILAYNMRVDAASADKDVYEQFLQKVAYRRGALHDHISFRAPPIPVRAIRRRIMSIILATFRSIAHI